MKTAIANNSFSQVSPLELYNSVQKYISDIINFGTIQDMIIVDKNGTSCINENNILNKMLANNITLQEILKNEFICCTDSGTIRFLNSIMFETLNLQYPHKFSFPLLNKLLGNFTHRYHNESLFIMPAIEKLVDNAVIENLTVDEIKQLDYTSKQFKKTQKDVVNMDKRLKSLDSKAFFIKESTDLNFDIRTLYEKGTLFSDESLNSLCDKYECSLQYLKQRIATLGCTKTNKNILYFSSPKFIFGVLEKLYELSKYNDGTRGVSINALELLHNESNGYYDMASSNSHAKLKNILKIAKALYPNLNKYGTSAKLRISNWVR